ncbi:MAG TPA: cold shock domain-containing protein [Planctomycetota bacterium]|nr:cold shock domain-containing protein [Planctomycetota bacterium]
MGDVSMGAREGVCKWWERTYGFIRAEGVAEDIFVHQEEIVAAGFRHLVAGQRVRFDLVQTGRGFQARGVRPVAPVGYEVECPKCLHHFLRPE